MEVNMESLAEVENRFVLNQTIDGVVYFIQYLLIALAVITIIINIKNKKNFFTTLIISIIAFICYWIGNVSRVPTIGVLADGSTQNQLPSIILGYILIIISIIIQLIPFIMCLRKNKNVKKDEVKQENV